MQVDRAIDDELPTGRLPRRGLQDTAQILEVEAGEDRIARHEQGHAQRHDPDQDSPQSPQSSEPFHQPRPNSFKQPGS